jgi:hypothetical protein
MSYSSSREAAFHPRRVESFPSYSLLALLDRNQRVMALTPNAVILRFTNSIPPDAAGGFVSLVGLREFAAIFLCCLPFVRPVERGGEGDIRDAVALDHCKDRIDGRRHCDNGNLPRRNRGPCSYHGGLAHWD